MPRFSILLPTHNRADVLPFALRSILGQSLQDFELLVVGDGCTDRTATIVRNFADERLRWFELPKAPHFGYANRNIALHEARGEFVAFAAHDDLWLPDHLELLSAWLEKHGAEIAYSRPLWVAPDGSISPGSFNLNRPEILAAFLSRKRNGIPAGCFLHRRECFAKYGYWNEDLEACGDWDMWARIIEGGGGKNFAYLPEPTQLHFRANWRTADGIAPPEWQVWRELHACADFMPPALKIKVTPGVTEQEAALSLMENDDARRWLRELRAAVQEVLDYRVLQTDEAVLEILRHERPQEMQAATLGQSLIRLSREVEDIQSSSAWKMVLRLRALKARLAPPDTFRGKIMAGLSKTMSRVLH